MKNESKTLVETGDVYDVELAGADWRVKVFAEGGGIRLLGSFPEEELGSEDWDFIKENLRAYNRNPINPNKF